MCLLFFRQIANNPLCMRIHDEIYNAYENQGKKLGTRNKSYVTQIKNIEAKYACQINGLNVNKKAIKYIKLSHNGPQNGIYHSIQFILELMNNFKFRLRKDDNRSQSFWFHNLAILRNLLKTCY